MKTPITITPDGSSLLEDLNEWIRNLDKNSVVSFWPFPEFTFHDEEDAIAFMLKFNGKRKYTKVEQMIKAEDDNNS